MRESGYGSPVTKRQIEVLKLAYQGLSNVEIGKRLSISRSTVESHLTDASVKLGSTGKMSSVAVALRNGLLS